MQQKTLVLVDGSYYMFRAFHVPQLQRLNNAEGHPTGVIFGVVNMIKKLITEYQPDYFAVVFDAKGKTFRHDLYADYKANRPPMPDELACQIQPLHDIIEASGIPKITLSGVEADDVIATLAKQAEQAQIKTLISTGDKDLAQLVNADTILLNPMQNVILDYQGVVDKFGVGPELILDYLTLIGDSVDNIPGVPKVGPKTAVKWLNQYGSLDAIVANAEDIGGKVGENLRASLDTLELGKQLITLKYDVELPMTPEQLALQTPDTESLGNHYQQWGFKSWLEDLTNAPSSPDQTLQEERDYHIVLSKKDFQAWLKRLQSAEVFSFDTETTSLDYTQAKVVGVSFAVSPYEAAYVPLAHDYIDAPQQLDKDYVLKELKPLLENGEKKILGQNLKYDRNVLIQEGIHLNNIAHDTMLQSYVYNSVATRHDMDSLASHYLGEQTIHYEDVAGKGAKQIPFNQVNLEQAGPYAAEDADITLRLHNYFQQQLAELPAQEQLYQQLEIPLIEVLSDMESRGVMVDADMLAKQSDELQQQLQGLEQEIYTLAGESFNVNSPKQIQAILYEKNDLPVLAKTPKGQPSTAESVLQELAQDYELPQLILDHRSLGKLKSTYTDKLPQQINPSTGRIHTSYHQAVAATGRLSSSDPNLQNIPVRTEQGRRIREAFIPAPGFVLMAADYSQIELRIMAHLSGDERLQEAFQQQEDVHSKTAAEVFDTPLQDVSKDQRRAAKAINFGLIYGMSAFGLGKQLGITRNEANDYINTYFARYPGVKDYMDRIREQARAQGYVETLFHRRLYLPEIESRNAMRRQYAERTAINAPMQGTAADIIKRSMIDCHAWLETEQMASRMIMQVHDELVIEVASAELETVSTHIRELMIAAADLSVPLDVDIGVGNNWNAAH